MAPPTREQQEKLAAQVSELYATITAGLTRCGCGAIAVEDATNSGNFHHCLHMSSILHELYLASSGVDVNGITSKEGCELEALRAIGRKLSVTTVIPNGKELFELFVGAMRCVQRVEAMRATSTSLIAISGVHIDLRPKIAAPPVDTTKKAADPEPVTAAAITDDTTTAVEPERPTCTGCSFPRAVVRCVPCQCRYCDECSDANAKQELIDNERCPLCEKSCSYVPLEDAEELQ